MTDDLGPEDRTLGTALSRAVEAQSVRETRFEESRLGVDMNKRKRGSFLLPAFATIAAVLVGLLVGTSLLNRGTAPSQVATSPSPTAGMSPGPSSTTAPASPVTPVPVLVYFGRDGLPPVAGTVQAPPLAIAPADRIRDRVIALLTTPASEAPSPATNAVSVRRSRADTQPTVRVSAQISGDLATVDIDISSGWQIRGAAAAQAAVQQLVYTITEESGIRRATINSNGMPATIDQLTLGKPLTREDVAGYSVPAERSLTIDDEQRAATATTNVSNEVVAPALGRLTIELRPTTPVQGGFWSPRLRAELLPTIPGSRSKWALSVTLPGVTDPRSGSLQGAGPFQEVDGSPIQGLRIRNEASGVTYELFLVDARPWRIALERGANGTMRVLVDVGGHPSMVANNTAVYAVQGGPGRQAGLGVFGVARAFEATVNWRLRDRTGREVAKGFTNASIGTSPYYGTFEFLVQLPPSLDGGTLDVYQASPRDGSDTDKVSIAVP